MRGIRDIFGKEMKKYAKIEQICYKFAEQFGYERVILPNIESEEVFRKTIGLDSDIISKEMYKIEGKHKLVLRPEGTAQAMRFAIGTTGLLQGATTHPLKLFYCGPMYRHDRPQRGRYREFHQFGVEQLGGSSYFADFEVIFLASRILKELLGVIPYELHINSIGDQEARSRFNEALFKYFSQPQILCKLSQGSQEKVIQKKPLFKILDSKDERDMNIAKDAPEISEFLNQESTERLAKCEQLLKDEKIPYIQNSHLVRGVDYYCKC